MCFESYLKGCFCVFQAGVAQLVEQLICNQQVAGSSPIASSSERMDTQAPDKIRVFCGWVPKWPKGTGCKPVGSSLRRFESFPIHHYICQSDGNAGFSSYERALRWRSHVCGSSSVGRALAFQAKCREFDPRLPLQLCLGSSVGRARPW